MFVYRGREPISAKHRLVIALRFMATGAGYRTLLQWDFCVAHNTLSIIVREVAVAICEEFNEEVFACPRDEEGWRRVAEGFSNRWNFEHCLGAIDGKHVKIVKPKGSGRTHFNYKGFCSIVLLGIVDSEYKFLWADVGAPGACSDGGIWNNSTLKKRVARGRQGLPEPEPLPGHRTPVPWFFVGDAAFALAPWLQKPYPQRGTTRSERLFNYRLSRARRVVENGFGILTVQWRCLTVPMGLAPENASKVVSSCVTLHNLIRERRGAPQPGEVDQGDQNNGAWRQGRVLRNNRNLAGARQSSVTQRYRDSVATRDYLRRFYTSPEGAVRWQDRIFDVRRAPEEPQVPNSDSDSDAD